MTSLLFIFSNSFSFSGPDAHASDPEKEKEVTPLTKIPIIHLYLPQKKLFSEQNDQSQKKTRHKPR